jgi:putative GTP pyrophosphokinase
VEPLITEYISHSALYKRCTERFHELLERLLEGVGLNNRIHSVTSRLKDPEKVREKLNRGEGRYSSLADVTDLVGLRVITYFADDVDEVASTIEAEFDIDLEQSTDKRKAIDPDRFGYLSLHFVCGLKPERSELREYAEFKDIRCEIQVRSILQHAWAEIEHDLGYKTAAGIPAEMRRRFSRLAGLLEVADDEFRRLRQELDSYAARVGDQISRDPSSVKIDRPSLMAFVREDRQTRELDDQIARIWGRSLDEEPFEVYAERLVPWLNYVGIETIQDVRSALDTNSEIVLSHLKKAFASGGRSGANEAAAHPLPRGYGLYRLGLVLLAREGDPAKIVDAFASAQYGLVDLAEYAQDAVSVMAGLREEA